MATRLEGPQGKWQLAALETLLAEGGKWNRGPWIPSWVAMEGIREREGCTAQAATGALRALLTVGLAERAETSQTLWWKATEAAERMHDLIVPPLLAELKVIQRRLDGIDVGLDQSLWLQEIRKRLERLQPVPDSEERE